MGTSVNPTSYSRHHGAGSTFGQAARASMRQDSASKKTRASGVSGIDKPPSRPSYYSGYENHYSSTFKATDTASRRTKDPPYPSGAFGSTSSYTASTMSGAY